MYSHNDLTILTLHNCDDTCSYVLCMTIDSVLGCISVYKLLVR